MLPECNKNRIESCPVLHRQLLPKRHLSLKRNLSLDIPKPIHNPMNMNIHANRRFLECNSHNKVRGLSAHPRQSNQLINCLRNPTIKFLIQDCRQFLQILRLVMKESHRKNHLLHDARTGYIGVAHAGLKRFPAPSLTPVVGVNARVPAYPRQKGLAGHLPQHAGWFAHYW